MNFEGIRLAYVHLSVTTPRGSELPAAPARGRCPPKTRWQLAMLSVAGGIGPVSTARMTAALRDCCVTG